MEYTAFCKHFFAATNIPVSLLEEGNAIYTALGELASVSGTSHYHIYKPHHNPSFQAFSPDIVYGMVEIEGTNYTLVIGPVFSVPATEQIIRQFMRETGVAVEHYECLAECLLSLPTVSGHQLFNYLAFLHHCLNGKETDFCEYFAENQSKARDRLAQQMNQAIDAIEKGDFHNTYQYEREMYHYIKKGDLSQLKALLLENRGIILQEGKMAQTPLRHAKNLFINSVVKAGMLGAIPGGVDVERTYQLIDYYAQECERLQTIEDVRNLQYIMLTDLCSRANEVHIPEGVSSDIKMCINYIRSHVNCQIKVADVAGQTGKSVSSITKRFKREMGVSLVDYINSCKLETAKGLLTYSEKSLAEISSYLCFSNQSYFQNLFKKNTGITPLQYRKQSIAITQK